MAATVVALAATSCGGSADDEAAERPAASSSSSATASPEQSPSVIAPSVAQPDDPLVVRSDFGGSANPGEWPVHLNKSATGYTTRLTPSGYQVAVDSPAYLVAQPAEFVVARSVSATIDVAQLGGGAPVVGLSCMQQHAPDHSPRGSYSVVAYADGVVGAFRFGAGGDQPVPLGRGGTVPAWTRTTPTGLTLTCARTGRSVVLSATDSTGRTVMRTVDAKGLPPGDASVFVEADGGGFVTFGRIDLTLSGTRAGNAL